jgi:hypothetical protein
VTVPDCASRDPGGHPRLGRQVGSGRHPARDRSSATIERGAPGRRSLLRASMGDQHTPRADDRKFGADSKGGD